VARVRREAEVSWEGNVARGAGAITAATSGVFAGLPYSLPTRIAAATAKTSPEELLAAAHAGCYAMSLANELSTAGTPPERLVVRATCTLDEVDGVGHRIVSMDLVARARVPELEQARFEELAQTADESCTFSALVRASATISIDAQLD
jgi:osmotically inducible protein OsmC